MGAVAITGIYFVAYTNGRNACATANLEYNNWITDKIRGVETEELDRNRKKDAQIETLIRELETVKANPNSGCISSDQLRLLRKIAQ